MKVLNSTESTCFYVETDLLENPTFRRTSSSSWERLYGESWETEYFLEEKLEKAWVDYNGTHKKPNGMEDGIEYARRLV